MADVNLGLDGLYGSDSLDRFEFLKSLFARAETNDNILSYYYDTYQCAESITDDIVDISFHALKCPTNTWTEIGDMYINLNVSLEKYLTAKTKWTGVDVDGMILFI